MRYLGNLSPRPRSFAVVTTILLAAITTIAAVVSYFTGTLTLANAQAYTWLAALTAGLSIVASVLADILRR